MLSLPMPAEAVNDDDVLEEVCLASPLADHHASWQAAYDLYRRRRGNEFAVDAASYPAGVHAMQLALYKNRKNNAVFTALRQTVLVCCPMCGSPGTGALDHHLPEGRFGEFSILLSNLVPSCGHCNSGSKSTKGTGGVWPQRFLHPYYDRFANRELWRSDVSDPIAPVFIPRPEPALRRRLAALVQYNIDNLLGWQFRMHQRSYWSKLPVLIAGRSSPPAAGATLDFDVFWAREYFSATVTEGLNGWKAALLRGIRDDVKVHEHLLSLANALPRPV